MKVKLTKIYRTTTDKQGNPLRTREGKPYERLSIQTQEHGDQWLSGFGGKWNAFWQEGKEVEIEIEERRSEDGRVFLNFKGVDRVKALEERVGALEKWASEQEKSNTATSPHGPIDYPQDYNEPNFDQ